MLQITIPGRELFDDKTQEFFELKPTTIELEHSLVSLSKWEQTFEKPFLGSDKKTTEETLGYVEAMTLTEGIDPTVYFRLSDDNIKAINAYIDAKMSATWFRETVGQTRSREVITSELIYYWMTALNVPMACETWHLNRLFTFIKVINEKNKPQKKMSKAELAARNRDLNAQRKAQLQSAG